MNTIERIGTLNAGYKIFEASEIDGLGYCIASIETRYGKQYVTWEYNPAHDDDYFFGHYFIDYPPCSPIGDDAYRKAMRDYYRRINDAVKFRFENL